MSFFVDANVIVYAVAEDDSRQPGSIEIMDAISDARAVGVANSAVIEEVWHLEMSGRVPGLDGQARGAHTILRPLLPIDDEVLDIAFGLELPADTRLGANDRLHAATCIRYGITDIVTADRAFDDVEQLHRIDPIDQGALADLW
ncbi:MAG: type II toxin-antitoxin system VapC family toxin [Solirubrobacterales bacterium]